MAAGSRLGRRLLLLHLLLLLLPIGGMLYLHSFERTLLEQEERAMVAEARWVAAALGGPAPLSRTSARFLLRERERPLDARVRVVDAEGRLLADTVPVERRREIDAPVGERTRAERERWVYRVGASIWSFSNFLRRGDRAEYRPEPSAPVGSILETPEAARALAGDYGSATRVSPDGRFLVLSSAVPIRSGGQVVGAVVVSRTTLAVLEALDRVRLDVFRVLVVCLAVALAISFGFARLLVAPLHRLRDEAERLIDARGRVARRFSTLERKDELGDLARSLATLSDRLAASQAEHERFAADLAHELKNPLAAVRSAAELAAEVDDPGERRRLREIAEREIGRAERLLSELQALAAAEREEPTDEPDATTLEPFLRRLIEGWSLRRPGVDVVLVTAPSSDAIVSLSATRLARIVENLLDNAVSLAPAGSAVEIRVTETDRTHAIEVADRGPGIPDEHRERIFDRFFTWRPAEEEKSHLGLGLDIARSMARRAGGELVAENRGDGGGGACFRLTLPRG